MAAAAHRDHGVYDHDDVAAGSRARHPPARATRDRCGHSLTRYELQPPLPRIPGTAVFLNRGKETAPVAMRANVKHNRMLHEHVVIMSIETQPVPRVPVADRLVIDDLGYSDDGITHVTARCGYMDEPNIPGVLRLLETAEIERPVDVDDASYFLSKIELRRGAEPTMARWRKQISWPRPASPPTPPNTSASRDNTVIMGSRVGV